MLPKRKKRATSLLSNLRVRSDGTLRRATSLALPAVRLLLQSALATLVVMMFRAPPSTGPYFIRLTATAAVIWTLVISYATIAPTTYVSKWTLILPTSNSGVSLQLESIGHAQTIPSSPFGSSSLSPKVIYKEILGSDAVREAAAERLGIKPSALGAARVKLIDETALMLLQISGPTAADAQKRAMTLMVAFNDQLEALRRDEINRRAAIVEESLKTYRVNLQAARARILEHQQETGVLSPNQYNDAATGLELMRRRLTDVRGDIERMASEHRAMFKDLDIDSETAAILVRLAADPAFCRLLTDLAESTALHAQQSARFGDANPLLVAYRDRGASLVTRLEEMAAAAGITNRVALTKILFVANGSARADLIKTVVAQGASIAGRREELRFLDAEFQAHTAGVARMSKDLARLEDLKKDHLVAEAVFTSALARLDTNKIDIYASYPMVQVLSAPDLPERKSSPNTLIAVVGGILATVMATIGWMMAWLRRIFVRGR